ncbi:hypothetical protein AB0K09_07905 [Streptomyces sp. NPDC049577]|uniref:hypothetical protein n=1 Tax=Streptomyces sp. NPDC049577 TaxID=3155153 RepID=UPI00341B30AB
MAGEARPVAEHYGDLVRAALIEARPAGYMFSDEPADWIEYEKKQFRIILGRLTR